MFSFGILKRSSYKNLMHHPIFYQFQIDSFHLSYIYYSYTSSLNDNNPETFPRTARYTANPKRPPIESQPKKSSQPTTQQPEPTSDNNCPLQNPSKLPRSLADRAPIYTLHSTESSGISARTRGEGLIEDYCCMHVSGGDFSRSASKIVVVSHRCIVVAE